MTRACERVKHRRGCIRAKLEGMLGLLIAKAFVLFTSRKDNHDVLGVRKPYRMTGGTAIATRFRFSSDRTWTTY